jgi:hypothetical protein
MRLRFRIRSMVLAIVAIGLVLGGVTGAVLERRRAYYRSRVETFAWGEADIIERIAHELRTARELELQGPEGRAAAAAARLRAERLAEVAAWHVKMERLYAWAAEHPWATVPPGPPPPNPP